MKYIAGHHWCPKRGCDVSIPDWTGHLACRTHWYELSQETRNEILRTKRMNLLQPARRAALAAAYADWGQ